MEKKSRRISWLGYWRIRIFLTTLGIKIGKISEEGHWELFVKIADKIEENETISQKEETPKNNRK